MSIRFRDEKDHAKLVTQRNRTHRSRIASLNVPNPGGIRIVPDGCFATAAGALVVSADESGATARPFPRQSDPANRYGRYIQEILYRNRKVEAAQRWVICATTYGAPPPKCKINIRRYVWERFIVLSNMVLAPCNVSIHP